MLPDSDCSVSGLPARDFGLEEWLDDCDRAASDLQMMEAEDFEAYYLSPDATIPFDPPVAA